MLQDRWGIQSEIANYFANERKVPEGNAFWKNKRIYISGGFGFLTIPLAFDLMYKRGIPLNNLLNDIHVSLMEEGFDRLKRFEAGEYSFEHFVGECKELLKGHIHQQKLAADLFNIFSGQSPQFFSFETKHKALARSDSFLFTLVDLSITDEWVSNFLPYWYALARPILLLDDFKDLEDDRRTGDENTIIELGNNAEAIQKAYELGKSDLGLLETVNPLLSKQMQSFLKDVLQYKHIQEVDN
jgi:hypothetical protein